jgi:hypothetical protein
MGLSQHSMGRCSDMREASAGKHQQQQQHQHVSWQAPTQG